MQPNIKLMLAGGILAGALVHDIRISMKLRKASLKLVEENKNLRRGLGLTLKQMTYLCQLLDENGVTISEFDIIALNNPM